MQLNGGVAPGNIIYATPQAAIAPGYTPSPTATYATGAPAAGPTAQQRAANAVAAKTISGPVFTAQQFTSFYDEARRFKGEQLTESDVQNALMKNAAPDYYEAEEMLTPAPDESVSRGGGDAALVSVSPETSDAPPAASLIPLAIAAFLLFGG